MNKKAIIIIILILIVAVFAYGIYYINDYYHADDSAKSYINGSENVDVVKIDNGLFLDGPGNDSAVIFYPGAKVEYTSYLPLLMDLSNDGVDCFLVEMPFNIAFFGQNSADEIIDSYNYSDYFIAGHSLGGVVASQYVNQTNKTDGLILLESYSTSNIDKPVLSIYASNDKLLNMKEYEDSKHLIDTNLTEIVIDGGNHAQVGNYGFQKGDGKATISAEKQQDMIKNEILAFINSLVV